MRTLTKLLFGSLAAGSAYLLWQRRRDRMVVFESDLADDLEGIDPELVTIVEVAELVTDDQLAEAGEPRAETEASAQSPKTP
jgi:hypothetical protein